jgi:hypothetical protein
MIRIAAFSLTCFCLALATFVALEAYVTAWPPGEDCSRVAGVSIRDARPLPPPAGDSSERPCPREPDRSTA